MNTSVLLAQAGGQHGQASLSPRFDVVHPGVGLRENEGQPNTDDLTQTQPIPVAVGRKTLIQQPGHMHPVELGQQQRNIIDPFGLMVSGSVTYRELTSMSQYPLKK